MLLHIELVQEGIDVVTVTLGFMRTGSAVNAFFQGKHHAEYAWFHRADSLPRLSLSAKKAAQQIVRATYKRKVEITLTFPAKALTLLHGIFPRATMKMFRLTNHFLPKSGDATGLDRSN